MIYKKIAVIYSKLAIKSIIEHARAYTIARTDSLINSRNMVSIPKCIVHVSFPLIVECPKTSSGSYFTPQSSIHMQSMVVLRKRGSICAPARPVGLVQILLYLAKLDYKPSQGANHFDSFMYDTT